MRKKNFSQISGNLGNRFQSTFLDEIKPRAAGAWETARNRVFRRCFCSQTPLAEHGSIPEVWYGMAISGIRDAPCRSIPTHSCDLRQGRGSNAILRPSTWVHVYHNIRQHSHADKPQAYAVIVIGSKLPQSHTAYPMSLTLTCVAAYLATWTCASLPRGRIRRKAGVRRNRPTKNPSPDSYHLPLSRLPSQNQKS